MKLKLPIAIPAIQRCAMYPLVRVGCTNFGDISEYSLTGTNSEPVNRMNFDGLHTNKLPEEEIKYQVLNITQDIIYVSSKKDPNVV